jgi:TalC/MipB family fructose-6-phosphate aldolase
VGLFVDSAYLEDVERICAGFPIAGVTTNPSILLAAREEHGQHLDDLTVLRELLRLCDGTVCMQPVGESAEDLYAAASRYVNVAPPRVVPKLPMTTAGLRTGMRLKGEGARIAFTAVSSLAQAYCATMAGASWVIPYYGRLRRQGVDPSERVGHMAQLLAKQEGRTRILAASIKSSDDLAEAALAGAHDMTVGPDVIAGLLTDALTEAAVRQFTLDWERAQQMTSSR